MAAEVPAECDATLEQPDLAEVVVAAAAAQTWLKETEAEDGSNQYANS